MAPETQQALCKPSWKSVRAVETGAVHQGKVWSNSGRRLQTVEDSMLLRRAWSHKCPCLVLTRLLVRNEMLPRSNSRQDVEDCVMKVGTGCLWSEKCQIQPDHPKGDKLWVFIGRTDAEAETPKFWPPHAKS